MTMGWDDPRWQQLYPPKTSAGVPAPEAQDYQTDSSEDTVPHYLELVAQEAVTNPASWDGSAPGLSISGPGGLL